MHCQLSSCSGRIISDQSPASVDARSVHSAAAAVCCSCNCDLLGCQYSVVRGTEPANICSWHVLIMMKLIHHIHYCNSLLADCNCQQATRWQTSTCTELRSSSNLWRRPSRARTPLLRDKLHWLRARERITFKLCLLVYKARNGMTPNFKLHTGLMCAGVNCFYPLCSPLRSSWRPGHRSYQTTSPESSIQRRRSCSVEQFAAGHSYCINTQYFQKSAQDLSVFSFISIINLISRSVCCMAPL